MPRWITESAATAGRAPRSRTSPTKAAERFDILHLLWLSGPNARRGTGSPYRRGAENASSKLLILGWPDRVFAIRVSISPLVGQAVSAIAGEVVWAAWVVDIRP